MKSKPSQPPATKFAPKRHGETVIICLLLAGLTWFTFLPILGHEFVNYDDDAYVYENRMVTSGLTAEGVVVAFTKSHAGNWHPLTTLSHMADCAFSGLNAGAHHRTNLLLHVAAVVLLFLALRLLTLSVWSSAATAALFAVHPLRVESVAWVAERKDVLSGLFFALTLWAYARYVRESKSIFGYVVVVLVFALGLMCKPMLVTLPFVLLLLDYWPLRRLELSKGIASGANRRLLLEKLPLLLLSLVVCVVTFLVQENARQSTEVLPVASRVNNAFVSYATYMLQLFWPVKLAVFYPYPTGGGTSVKVILASLVLIAVSAAAICWRKQRPYLLVGWLWYLGMLVPVIGLVQVGTQAHADRYTYLPQIGLGIALVWFVAELSAAWRHRRIVLGVGTIAVLITLSSLARQQTRNWQTSESLWTHTLACTSSNAVAESNLADTFFKQDRLDEAITHFQAALAIKPKYTDANNGLGFALLQKGNVEAAMACFQRALEVRPDFAAAHNNLGMALLQTGRTRKAIPHLESALKTDPDRAETHNNLGYALLQSGQVEMAVTHYQRALELDPTYAAACNNLAWVLATFPQDSVRNGGRAVELANRAAQLSGGNNLIILRTQAAAYAEAGRFSEALQIAGHALDLAATQGNAAVAGTIRREMVLYQSGQPLRDPVKP